jgi:Skp family chaperone for outer membrane proteins
MCDTIYRDRKDREEETKELKGKIKKFEEILLEGKMDVENVDRTAQEKIGMMEAEVAKERQERKVSERKVAVELAIQETMESERKWRGRWSQPWSR